MYKSNKSNCTLLKESDTNITLYNFTLYCHDTLLMLMLYHHKKKLLEQQQISHVYLFELLALSSI